MPRMPPSRQEAVDRLNRLNAVLTSAERTLMEEVCGKGLMLEDVAPGLNLNYDEALEALKSALNKMALLEDPPRGHV